LKNDETAVAGVAGDAFPCDLKLTCDGARVGYAAQPPSLA